MDIRVKKHNKTRTMKRTYITPETRNHKIELASVIAASVNSVGVSSEELDAEDAQFSRGFNSIWDDEEE